MMLLDCYKYKERGEEFKVPYHASAAAACDGNLPYCDSNMPHIKATCLIQLPLPFIPNKFIIVYLNNIIIYSKTEKEHYKYIK